MERVPAKEMEDLPIGVSLTGIPVEVEGKDKVDRLGGLLDTLSESLLKNVSSLLFARFLRPPSEPPGGEGVFD
jgi:hypothetical protein